MKLDANAHLTYCSNIHPGESWAEIRDALSLHVPQIRKSLAGSCNSLLTQIVR